MTPEARSQHPDLAGGRWFLFPLIDQLANTGSEVERALGWASKGRIGYSTSAVDRALELLDLTIADPKNRLRLRELTRVREALVDYFFGSNEYGSSSDSWHRYFHAYGMASALRRQAGDNASTR